MSIRAFVFCLLVLSQVGIAEYRVDFDPDLRQWKLSNGSIEAAFRLSPEGFFEFQSLRDQASNTTWRSVAHSSPIRLRVGDSWIDQDSQFRLLRQDSSMLPRGGMRQSIQLAELSGLGQIQIDFDLYDGLSVLRTGVRYRNSTEQSQFITETDLLPWRFSDNSLTFQTLRIEQWLPVAKPAEFTRLVDSLRPGGPAVTVESGAHGRHCAWLALGASNSTGLAMGWEFNGRADLSVQHDFTNRQVRVNADLIGVHHPVQPGEDFPVPNSFIALYSGGWDDAGFVTQRFVEQALAKKPPSYVDFPFVGWDSWGYGQEIDEATLRRNAELAAQLGIELFVADLGWASKIGDWRPDPAKFPSGLRALSDYVHSLGMKFGLHLAWAEVDPTVPVVLANPNWLSTESSRYYGAVSLCPAHKPAREWIINEAVRVIDEYNVDWILQDGENMVKSCTREDHTHDSLDSNYANAVEGLDYVVQEVQRRRPNTLWENCENGGNLMTFQMVQNYVTSIVNDASGARSARFATFGATYPFPTRYVDRYMPEQKMTEYVTRSYLFGGPWVFMNRLPDFSAEDTALARTEIARFKSIRGMLDTSKVLHLTAPPAAGAVDAIAAYDAASDSAIAVITRDLAASSTARLAVPGLGETRSYRVWFADSGASISVTGSQLREGITVSLPDAQDSEVIHIEPISRNFLN